MAELIEHSGVVDRTDGETVCVKIISQSACGSCSARQACGLAEAQDKIVEVRTPDATAYVAGEQVTVGVQQRAGAVAVFFAYVLSLVVLLAVLVVAIEALGWSEGVAALAGLLAVGGYFILLWLCRKKLETKIKITITKNY